MQYIKRWWRFTPFSQWFTVGLGIKRWLVLFALGSLLTGIGIAYLTLILHRAGVLPALVYDVLAVGKTPVLIRVLVPLVVGLTAVALALWRLISNLIAPFRPPDGSMVDSLYYYSKQGRGPHIVAIGGGTGLPSLLRGLTAHTRNITAIVTVADDGGSSGRLREELGVLPPGDFRNNIAALARDETLMTQLLQYRFGSTLTEKNSVLQGHALGNLILAALMGITGSFDEALLAAERVLALRGRVLPSTLETVNLTADVLVMNGSNQPHLKHIVGESAIPKAGGRISQVKLLPATARAYPPAIQAIFQADLIVLGPGSLYTSVLPNLLLPDLMAALQHTQATKVYICNVATQEGETDNYSVADHVQALLEHTAPGCVDIVLANDNLDVPLDNGRITLVQPIAPPETKMVTADLIDINKPYQHDSTKLAQAVIELLHRL